MIWVMRRLTLTCALALALGPLALPAEALARPQTRITAGPANRVTVAAGSRVRFSFAASVRRAHFQCSLDGRRFRACRSPVTYRGLKAGRHRFAVRAIDRFGRTDRTPARRSFSVVALTPHAQTTWAPVGSRPLADGAAAALVTHRPEVRAGNAGANAYVPSDAELAAFHAAHNSYGE